MALFKYIVRSKLVRRLLIGTIVAILVWLSTYLGVDLGELMDDLIKGLHLAIES
jgi:hypothetical protein